MNGYNFTERVRKVLAMTRDDAKRLHHEYIGPEHLLLGLIREGEGVGVAALRNLDIDLDAVKQQIEAVAKPGKTMLPTGPDLPYTSRAKKSLELAMTEARDLNHSYVGTEHLLIGLIREERGIAAQVLIQAGATLAVVRTEVMRFLGMEIPERFPRAIPFTLGNTNHSGRILTLKIEVQFADGVVVQEKFTTVEAAIGFLMIQRGAQ